MDKASGMGVGQKRQRVRQKKCDMAMSLRSKKESKRACIGGKKRMTPKPEKKVNLNYKRIPSFLATILIIFQWCS